MHQFESTDPAQWTSYVVGAFSPKKVKKYFSWWILIIPLVTSSKKNSKKFKKEITYYT